MYNPVYIVAIDSVSINIIVVIVFFMYTSWNVRATHVFTVKWDTLHEEGLQMRQFTSRTSSQLNGTIYK